MIWARARPAYRIAVITHPAAAARKIKNLGGDKVRTGRQKREIERAIVEKTKKTKVKVRLWVDGSG